MLLQALGVRCYINIQFSSELLTSPTTLTWPTKGALKAPDQHAKPHTTMYKAQPAEGTSPERHRPPHHSPSEFQTAAPAGWEPGAAWTAVSDEHS